MKVFLNPRDLVLITNYLNSNNTEVLFLKGCVIIDHARVGAPLPRMRFRKGVMEFCPFLENSVDEAGRLSGKCLLHPGHKPLVCTLSPLGREVDLGLGEESWEVKSPLPGCPGGGLALRICEEPDISFEPRIRARLDEEREFFEALSAMLYEKLPETEIIRRLYYIRTDNCIHSERS
jgi:hypothetical protein